MMKLFEEKRSLPLRDLHPELPRLPDDVEVPDDLSGMQYPDVVIRRRPVRWLRWTTLGLFVLGGGLAVALLAGDSSSDTPSDPAALPDGPGTNSLNLTPIAAEPTTDATTDAAPAALPDGPGTNSLNLTPIAAEPVSDDAITDLDLWIEHEGPGSHSLNVVTP